MAKNNQSRGYPKHEKWVWRKAKLTGNSALDSRERYVLVDRDLGHGLVASVYLAEIRVGISRGTPPLADPYRYIGCLGRVENPQIIRDTRYAAMRDIMDLASSLRRDIAKGEK